MWYVRQGVYAYLHDDCVDYFNLTVGYTYSYAGVDIMLFQSHWQPAKIFMPEMVEWEKQLNV